MSAPVTLVWLRRDLRIDDNPALAAAAERGAVVPVFIWSPDEEDAWAPGAASRWWLHHSLTSFEKELARHGSQLIVRKGKSQAVLDTLLNETGADAVYWNRVYEPAAIARDTKIKASLRKNEVEAESFNSQLLFEPWEVKTKEGKPYQVFTAYWKSCLAQKTVPEPIDAPKKLKRTVAWPDSLEIDELSLLPKIPWDTGMHAAWKPGSVHGLLQFQSFLDEAVTPYAIQRDFPGTRGTSRLSPYLHFGEISPRFIWHAVDSRLRSEKSNVGAETFLKELVWREFAHHLLFHFPHTPDEPLRAEFAKFPWEKNQRDLRAWQQGQTGYPIVDAGMRELWTTGWMHNRVRMIVASFLVKDLRIAWQEGAKWFWDTLVDADLANNTLGWQWSAGCGADAAPYFRVFNPTLQSDKFDSSGEYIRQWVPELKRLPDKWLHQPWEAPDEVLRKAGVELDKTYPSPIVDHGEAREKALAAFAAIRK